MHHVAIAPLPSWRSLEVGPQAPDGGFDVSVVSARTALQLLVACREAYGETAVRDSLGQLIDADELSRLAELEPAEDPERMASSQALATYNLEA